jgi:hypothetical protein
MSTELDSGGLSEPATPDTAPTTEIAAIKGSAAAEPAAEAAAAAETAVIAVVVTEVVATETAPKEAAPSETAPYETAPYESAPSEAAPGETVPSETVAAEPEAPSDPVEAVEPAPAPRRKAGHRARRKAKPVRSTRLKYAAVGVLVAVAVAASVTLPSVKTVLKQSFTRLPQPYAALYFTSDPTLDGAALTVPISVQPTDEGVRSYTVRVWTVTAAGTVDPDATAATVSPKNGVWATVVTLTIAPTAAVVWVALDGTQQTLHYRINGA